MLSGFELYSRWVPLSPRGFKTEKASLWALEILYPKLLL